MTKVDAVTFDDFNTLRYQVGEQEDIIYSILRAMETKIVISEPDFLEAYFRANKSYRGIRITLSRLINLDIKKPIEIAALTLLDEFS